MFCVNYEFNCLLFSLLFVSINFCYQNSFTDFKSSANVLKESKETVYSFKFNRNVTSI
jgi:hypothetical protein